MELYEAFNNFSFHSSVSRGVDDLLPIMTYIIIRSGMPQLVTESAVLQEFVDEK